MSAQQGKPADRPGAGTLAGQLRDGATLAEVAESHGLTVNSLKGILSRAGYGQTGHPRRIVPSRPGGPPLLLVELSWHEDAACARPGVDPEWFYPDSAVNPAEALAVCAVCPVRTQCLTHALDNDQRHGVWGGLREAERDKLKRHKPPRAGTRPCGLDDCDGLVSDPRRVYCTPVCSARAESRRQHSRPRPKSGNPQAPRRQAVQKVNREIAARLARLGATYRDVRVWAWSAGVDCPVKGRFARSVLDAYETAHAAPDRTVA